MAASLDGSDGGRGSPATVTTDESPSSGPAGAPASTSSEQIVAGHPSQQVPPTPLAGSSASPTVRSTPSFHVSKRAPKACGNCHRRKVRCDAHLNADGQPCSYCRSTGHECVLLPGRRGSTYQKTKKRLAAQAAAFTSTAGSSSSSHKHPPPSARPRRHSESKLSASSHQTTGSLLSPKGGPKDFTAFPPRRDAGQEINPSLSDEHVWVQFLDKAHGGTGAGGVSLEQQLTAHSTPNYRQRQDDFEHTRDSSAERDQDGKRQVLIFNGETALDGAVPTIAGLQSMQNGSAALDPQLDSSLPLHNMPTSSTPASWTTITLRSHITDLKIIPEDDKLYLLDHKKVNIFPAIEICDKLVNRFFNYIYPHMPILNRPAFIRGYKRMITGEGTYSLLLLHAVLYASTYHCSTEILKECGFENRLTARAYFFSRAKLVHMMDAEKEHLYTIQGCILMSIWWTRYEEEKETRFWLQAAVLLSQRMGMHRSIRRGWGLGASEKRMWKRIWWTLYSRDHITASSLGKPSLIRLTDCDVSDLEEDDFVENWGNMSEEEIAELCPSQHPVNIKYCVETAKLGKIYERIAAIQYSCTHRPSWEDLDKIANDLTTWKSNLPPELSTDRYDEMRTWTSENFWPLLLQLVHDRAVSMHFRPRCSRPKDGSSWGTGYRAMSEENMMKETEKARKAVVSAASNTFRLIEDLLRHDLLKFAPAGVQTPLFIAMIVYAEEIKLAPEGSTRHSLATNKITVGMMALGELRKIWAASSWTFRLFEFIIKNKFVGIGKPEMSVSGDAGVSVDAAIHTGLNPHNPHVGMHPIDSADVCQSHTDLKDLIVDPQLAHEGGNGAPGALPMGMMNSLSGSAAPASIAPMPGGPQVFWTPGAAETLSPDAAAHVMWNGQHAEMMQWPQTAESWGGGFPGGAAMPSPCAGDEDPGGFDLTWLAMSGLMGDMPFHAEGGQVPGGGGAVGYAGAQDTPRMAGEANAARMGTTTIDLWKILGLGGGNGF
ncbi:hypothetical protein DRE_03417 [Drechslerella stenobrocha 248]|uniref:Zn(2)-C6 fungal-type domain-containing protein n=1 Tax=Drechslerella stenobrocha 248 TaxID=1043628 RepID=W7I541_9PEZI|nr:hypothetical protein DRE_03417 [Drechslerella stenobrocha 248]